MARVRALAAEASTFEPARWREAAQLGWTTLLVPEAAGGGSISGNGLADLLIVASGFGRHAAPGSAARDERRRRRARPLGLAASSRPVRSPSSWPATPPARGRRRRPPGRGGRPVGAADGVGRHRRAARAGRRGRDAADAAYLLVTAEEPAADRSSSCPLDASGRRDARRCAASTSPAGSTTSRSPTSSVPDGRAGWSAGCWRRAGRGPPRPRRGARARRDRGRHGPRRSR